MRISLILVFLIFTCLVASAQSFKISTQKDIDLKQYKTFNVVKGEIASSTSRKIDNEAFYTEFKNFVVRELESKGYVYAAESAEVSVSYVVEISKQMETEDLGPLGGAPVDNAALVDQPAHWSREFTEGTLIIDMQDVLRKKTIWTATGTMDVTKAKGVKLLDRCVQKAFKKFPKKDANKKG
ncbi:MAG TPA: DUF4136 domain-containing protein [Cyclobacteriaceae bacterium]